MTDYLQYYDNAHVFFKDLLLVWLCEKTTVVCSLSPLVSLIPHELIQGVCSKVWEGGGIAKRCPSLADSVCRCVCVCVCVCVRSLLCVSQDWDQHVKGKLHLQNCSVYGTEG